MFGFIPIKLQEVLINQEFSYSTMASSYFNEIR